MRKSIVFILILLSILTLLVSCKVKIEEYELILTVHGKGKVVPGSGYQKKGTVITFTLEPEEGWAFSHWEGKNKAEVLEKKAGVWTLLMDGDKEITAVFEKGKYMLDVTIVGNGTVTPQSGIYDEEDLISLVVEPVEGWVFSHWEGRDGGDVTKSEGEWTLLMDGDKEITAIFKQIDRNLKIITYGRGRVEQEILAAPEDSSDDYPQGTQIKLTAVASEGSQFDKWSGSIKGTDPVQIITMDTNKLVKAHFEEKKYTLTVTSEGGGSVISSLESGVDHGNGEYDYDSKVKLTAKPEVGWVFARWEGDADGDESPLIITIDDHKEIKAIFEVAIHTLTLKTVGQGRIEQEINSGKQVGDYEFEYGSQVKLTAIADEGWNFNCWSEGVDEADKNNSCITVIMDEDKTLAADFTMYAMAQISGTVTDTRGGPALAGARVSVEYADDISPGSSTTNGDGWFSLDVRAERHFDLIIEKEGYGGTRIQDIRLEEDEEFELITLCREANDPAASGIPPRFDIQGVARGDVLSGPFEISMYFEGGVEPERIGVFYNMEPSGTDESDGNDYSPDLFSDDVIWEEDSIYLPNGLGYFFIHAYDHNGGYVRITIPVEIDNEPGEPSDDVPQKPGDPYIRYEARTYKQKAGLYSTDDPRHSHCGIQSIPADTTMYIWLEWFANKTADDFRVYRRLEGEDYVCVAEQVVYGIGGPFASCGFYYDYGPDLEPGVPVYYKIVPYNDQGEGWAYEGFCIPFPILDLEVDLLEPASGEEGVPLKPTFKWEELYDIGSQIPADYELLGKGYQLYIYDETGEKVCSERLSDEGTEITIRRALKPNTRYSWDIVCEKVYALYEVTNEDNDGYASYSWPTYIPGDGNGPKSISSSGPMFFTTGAGD